MFRFSQRSLDRLEGVHPDLVELLKASIKTSMVDFGVTEGLRTVERQRELVDKKLSQTMNSKHLRQDDGWGHAVDLVPYRGSSVSWEWKYIFEMAQSIQETMRNMTMYKGYPRIRWGGAWTLLNTDLSPKQLQERYIRSCVQIGKKPFLDGPHFEIIHPNVRLHNVL